MLKSIRGALLFGYAVLLAAVVAGFGGTLYYKVRRSLFREVDSRLLAHAQALAGALEREGGGGYDLELSDDYVRIFSSGGRNGPYYAIWDETGALVDRSRPELEAPLPASAGARDRGRAREVAVRNPQGAWVLVGQRISGVREKLRELAGAIAGAGGGVLLLALAGGWFLIGRALGPIRTITEAAEAISESNLSRRIDVAQTQSELGRLARTLNATFDRLERAFARQTRFTADASHELRTPLSVILTQAELALRRERSPAEYREALEACLRAAQRMKAAVEGLLTLARADAGTLVLKRERVDLRKLLEETAAMLGPLALERRVAVTVSAEAATVEGDPDRLREVFANLLSNAIRYNREGGRVEATLQAAGGEAVLTVADTGVGIPEKDRPHIFERFYRVDPARSREAGGTGLGLSIAKWAVEAHGGTISFTSREGEGTTFVVRLPAADA
ncbi:MAG TPA: heavy metal sensor histidine kinase [Planctomycetota bacterium]|nr:heavy metal sensor histidine kinase [Planctomycetota bacterium]